MKDKVNITTIVLQSDEGDEWVMKCNATLYAGDTLNISVDIKNPGGAIRPKFIGVRCPECKSNLLADSNEDYVCEDCRERIVNEA